MNETLDCAVIGGGAAGLSAGLVLGRARRRTLLVDSGRQSNRPSHGIGGLLGHDGRDPAGLYRIGREELAAYPSVEVIDGEAVRAARNDSGDFEIELADGSIHTTRRLILATGMDYRVDRLPGFEELWGNSVFHCPFCHGWEARDGALAVRASGDHGFHAALMLRGWSDDIVLLADGPAGLTEEQLGKLEAAGVRIDERPVASLRAEGGNLAAVRFTDGTEIERSGLMVAARLQQRTDLAAQLGARHAEPNPMAVDRLVVDDFQRTTVPGVFVAGDASGQFPQVAAAIAAGSRSAAFVVHTLLAEDFGVPIPPALSAPPA